MQQLFYLKFYSYLISLVSDCGENRDWGVWEHTSADMTQRRGNLRNENNEIFSGDQ
jgi:hypothetical protein